MEKILVEKYFVVYPEARRNAVMGLTYSPSSAASKTLQATALQFCRDAARCVCRCRARL